MMSHVCASSVTLFFFFQAEDGIRDHCVTGVQTCALPICCFFFHPPLASAPARPHAACGSTAGQQGQRSHHPQHCRLPPGLPRRPWAGREDGLGCKILRTECAVLKQVGIEEGAQARVKGGDVVLIGQLRQQVGADRKSTRLNSSHTVISYAVFCLKKKIYSVAKLP